MQPDDRFAAAVDAGRSAGTRDDSSRKGEKRWPTDRNARIAVVVEHATKSTATPVVGGAAKLLVLIRATRATFRAVCVVGRGPSVSGAVRAIALAADGRAVLHLFIRMLLRANGLGAIGLGYHQ